MLGLLIRKELLTHALSYRFVVTLLLFFVLIVSSVQLIALNYDQQLTSYAEAKRAQEEVLKEVTDFRTLQWSGIQVEKRPNPLSVFAQGLDKEMSRSVTVSRYQEAKVGRRKYANPLFVLFPAPDLIYIVNIVASLLAVLFAFDAICGEQEEGTLKLIMANAVPRHRVLLAKWIGGYIALILPFLLSVLASVLIAHLSTSLAFSGTEWAAFAGFVGVSGLYISVFFALGMWISTLTHRSTTSLVLTFLIWVVWVLVIPNTAPMVARALAPIPSVGVVAGQREAIQRSIWSGMRSRMHQAGTSEARRKMHDDIRAQIQEETDKILEDYLQRVDAQIGLGLLLGRVSPSANFVFAAAHFAGSGVQDFSTLRDYIRRYRQEFIAQVQQLQQERNHQAQDVTDPEERQAIEEAPMDPEILPKFDVGFRSASETLVSSQTDILILLVLNVLFFLGAYMNFLRYDLMK